MARGMSATLHLSCGGWLQVFEYGDQEPVTLAFCSWNCLMKRAAEIPPPTVIPWQQALGTDEEPS
jgi:hypothetical protein